VIQVSYVLPIRSTGLSGLNEFTQYLRALDVAELIVVDGSPPDVFAAHAACWTNACTLVRPDELPNTPNGKVRGVLTGLRYATQAKVVVADDDVRYGAAELARAAALLDEYAIVRPQNYFDPLPWHAVLDTSRTLINRVTGGDWPGTLAFRRSALPSGYRGDVLFENLELTRTTVALGGRELIANDLYVRRLPPTTEHYWSQRVRQAYDEWARPLRLAAALLILPVVLNGCIRKRWSVPASLAIASIAAAEIGRRTSGGTGRFPAASALFAPLWVLERGICAWAAVYLRLRGGVRYGAARLRAAATPARLLRSRP
jgi:hypothetical protein